MIFRCLEKNKADVLSRVKRHWLEMTGDVSSGVAAWPRTEEAAQHDAGINRTLFSARIVNPSLSVHKTGKI